MPLRGKKLGLLISVPPANPAFRHGVRLAEAALKQGINVYLYCIDEAVNGLTDPELQNLKAGGAHLFACAFGAQQRNIQLTDLATFAGLTVVSELIASTDRFVSFN